MHDYDVRRMHLTEDDARDTSQSLQAILYVDGHVERAARRNRRGRIVRAVFSTGAVAFAFAIGFFAFRVVRPHGVPQNTAAASVLDVDKRARSEAQRHQIAGSGTSTRALAMSEVNSQFLPAMPPDMQDQQAAQPVVPKPVAVHKPAASPQAVVHPKPAAETHVVAAVTARPQPTVAPTALPTIAPTPAAAADASAAQEKLAAQQHAAHELAAKQAAAKQLAARQQQARLYAEHLVRQRRHELAVAHAEELALVAAPAPAAEAHAGSVAHRHKHHKAAATAPSIVRFTADPQTIAAGGGSTICVAARHASQLSVSLLGEFHPLGLACRRVSPHETTTYTAWAVNDRGETVSDDVTVTVAQ